MRLGGGEAAGLQTFGGVWNKETENFYTGGGGLGEIFAEEEF